MKILSNRARELLAIKMRLEGRTITQRDIVAETGISLATVSKWMRNDVQRLDAPIVLALMEYFNCSLQELIVIEEIPNSGEIKTPLTPSFEGIALVG
jgi:transcriptional regulator with XRE-family HTH domain